MQVPAWAAVALVVLVAVSPGLSGAIAPRGTFSDMARQWKQAGAWLSERADDGRALVVPAASFGEYDWGRTIDEPIRPLSSADYAVRDAVPLTPAGTTRVLDAVEQRLQTGRDVGGAVDVLRRDRGALPRAAQRPRHRIGRAAVGGLRALRDPVDARDRAGQGLRR